MANSPGQRVTFDGGGELIVTQGGEGTIGIQQEGDGFPLGKRYECEACGTQSLVTKSRDEGSPICCDAPMSLQEPKELASSD